MKAVQFTLDSWKDAQIKWLRAQQAEAKAHGWTHFAAAFARIAVDTQAGLYNPPAPRQ